jgi:hypothetical protein
MTIFRARPDTGLDAEGQSVSDHGFTADRGTVELTHAKLGGFDYAAPSNALTVQSSSGSARKRHDCDRHLHLRSYQCDRSAKQHYTRT